ncbi:hypothetical protein EJ06DRAFT_531798 [Trichodelitschia bisporula]|uniref:Uncharacterized protein n=1 Tax=Trichodelitschia bisporula TaxID=703511 RepID=A0A6G1HS83_9PEZI|nr:hypothetical protein EJ06DRAFT_531798 [Trichodelitschia bisporula]
MAPLLLTPSTVKPTHVSVPAPTCTPKISPNQTLSDTVRDFAPANDVPRSGGAMRGRASQ